MVRAEDLWHWLRLVLWVRAPLLATLCVTYILRSSHITHYFNAVVDPDMTYLVSVGSLSNMHFICISYYEDEIHTQIVHVV